MDEIVECRIGGEKGSPADRVEVTEDGELRLERRSDDPGIRPKEHRENGQQDGGPGEQAGGAFQYDPPLQYDQRARSSRICTRLISITTSMNITDIAEASPGCCRLKARV